MESVWLLQHVHAFDDGNEDVKLIGVYVSREDAEAAQRTVWQMPGFRETPEGFSISEHRLGVTGWTEGFVTVEPVSPGMVVRIDAVDSCLKELPAEDQDRLCALVGQVREVAEIDSHGFVWLAFESGQRRADFSLYPSEVTRVSNEEDV